MTPPDHLEPDLLQRAHGFDVAAKIAHEKQDHVFAQALANHAHYLRMTHERGVMPQPKPKEPAT